MKSTGVVFLLFLFAHPAIIFCQCFDIEQEVVPPILGDIWGMTVDICGEWAVVGSPRNSDNMINSGAVDFYKQQQDGSWQFMDRVYSSDIATNGNFGWEVAIDGDQAIVGELRGQSGGTTFLERDGDGWFEIQRIVNDGTYASNFFGFSCAISGDYAVAGNPPYVNVYERNKNGTWSRVAFFQSSGLFGYHVAIDNYTLVAAGFLDSNPVVAERDKKGTWQIVDQLQNLGGGVYGAAISGDNLVLCVKDNSTGPPPRIRTYERSAGGDWMFEQSLTVNIGETKGSGPGEEQIRNGVDMDGPRIVIGARRMDANDILDSGAVFVYEKQPDGNWLEAQVVTASNGEIADLFGNAAAIDGPNMFVGASRPYQIPDGGSQGKLYFYGSSDAACDLTDVLVGDVNLDGSIDLLDVAPFVELLSSGGFQSEADINQDGVVNLLDVGPFVDLLTGG